MVKFIEKYGLILALLSICLQVWADSRSPAAHAAGTFYFFAILLSVFSARYWTLIIGGISCLGIIAGAYLSPDFSHVPDIPQLIFWNRFGSVLELITVGIVTQWMSSIILELRARQARTDAVQQTGLVGVWEWDIIKNEIYWDDHMYHMYGARDRSDFDNTYAGFESFLTPNSAKETGEIIEKCLEEKKDFVHKFEVVKKTDGSRATINALGKLQLDAFGHPIKMTGVNWDISQIEQMDGELQDERARFKDLLENLRGAFWIWDNYLQGPVFVSNEYEEIFGRPMDPMFDGTDEGQDDWKEPIVPEDQEEVHKKLDLQWKTEELDHEFRIVVKGEMKWVHTRGFPVYEKGKSLPARFVGVTEDITERKTAEIRLKESESRLRNYLEYSPVCTKILDLDFNLLYMSAAGIKGLGIEDADSIIGKPYPLEFYPPEFKDAMNANLKASLDSKEILEQEATVYDTAGKTVWFHSTIVPVCGDDGEVDYMMVVSNDTTEAQEYQDRLERINADLQQFAHATSHDLQEPLRMISGFSSLLGDEVKEITEDGAFYLAKIEANAERMSEMIRNILEFSRAGSAELERTEVDLNKVIDNIKLDLPSASDIVRTKGLRKIVASEALVYQVLKNFVSNSAKAGSTDILVEYAEDDKFSYLAVTDDGDGIPLEYQDHIFKPFYKGRKGGSGIGLATVKRIINRIGGEVWFESKEGEGAKFIVSAPRVGDGRT